MEICLLVLFDLLLLLSDKRPNLVSIGSNILLQKPFFRTNNHMVKAVEQDPAGRCSSLEHFHTEALCYGSEGFGDVSSIRLLLWDGEIFIHVAEDALTEGIYQHNVDSLKKIDPSIVRSVPGLLPFLHVLGCHLVDLGHHAFQLSFVEHLLNRFSAAFPQFVGWEDPDCLTFEHVEESRELERLVKKFVLGHEDISHEGGVIDAKLGEV
mmetsp:Transcript_2237/g.2182  ORF Transcript_2237/g.2182 Transcript_2237/m.2182 type:complete len:209 (+) Transcript_2237:780-1406(+)